MKVSTPRAIILGALCGFYISLPLAFWSIAMGGGGHGSFFAGKVSFPWALLSAPLVLYLPWFSSFLVAALQFPSYGAFVGWKLAKGQRSQGLRLVSFIHALGAILALVLLREY